MKLFVWKTIDLEPFDIHAIKDFVDDSDSLCGPDYIYVGLYDKCDYLDTTRPFCKDCERILKKDYNINMKQLAINQKLGVG